MALTPDREHSIGSGNGRIPARPPNFQCHGIDVGVGHILNQELELMKYNLPDVDIDFSNRDKAVELLGGIPASIIKDDKATKHNTGMYYHDIPTDPLTGNSSMDHKVAEERGYFKLDFLNLGIYDKVRSEQHLDELIAKIPNWDRLTTDPEFVSKIVHISNYSDLLAAKNPNSVVTMAMFLAIIRPGKRHLRSETWSNISATVWDRDEADGYTFRKSHATSYAMAVAVHMNLIEEEE